MADRTCFITIAKGCVSGVGSEVAMALLECPGVFQYVYTSQHIHQCRFQNEITVSKASVIVSKVLNVTTTNRALFA